MCERNTEQICAYLWTSYTINTVNIKKAVLTFYIMRQEEGTEKLIIQRGDSGSLLQNNEQIIP